MKEFKGTPGPWLVGKDSSVYQDDTYQDIIGGVGFFEPRVGFCITGFISNADANLMASAPDLLRALQQLVAINEPGDDYCPEINQAHEAISKALGE